LVEVGEDGQRLAEVGRDPHGFLKITKITIQ